MKCCNDNCQQGRECPNKPTYKLPQWQDVVTIGLLCVLVFTGAYFYMNDHRDYKIYDCNLVEISPDFPIQAKEACRQLRANK